MPNVITPYDPIWYAQKSLERLEKRLTFAPTMYRAYEETARTKGSTIEIKKPGGFAATNMPSASAMDLTPSKIQMVLDQWKGVQFALDDKELAYSGEEIIRDHIDPSMQAVAEAIEGSCTALYADVPWFVDADDTTPIKDFTAARKQQNDNLVSFSGRSAAINYAREQKYLEQEVFHSAEKSSDGTATQREGFLGRKFGYDVFTNGQIPNHVQGALVPTGSATVVSTVAVNGTSVVLTAATSLTGTIKKGDVLTFTGHTQKYAITADATAAGNQVTANISPAAQAQISAGTVWTIRQLNKGISLFYHREAFALVMAPLSDAGHGRGADIGVAIDDQTGLAIRVMRWYDPLGKKHWLSFDALWGVKTLDPNKAVRLEGAVI